ncbi:sensor histidine kinase [Streptomyces sp. NBC_00448]|uniref:sensor histidine kinase n=1 Tax=Streptomyces sp. NBC_00448 TaxID=2903652 RepID=UPI002E1F0A32
MFEDVAPSLTGSRRALGQWWRARGAAARDSVLAGVVTAVAFTPGLAHYGVELGELAPHRSGALRVLLILGQALPLAVRRRWPAVCLALVAGAFAVDQSIGYTATFAGLGLVIALYSAGAHLRRLRGVVAVVATAAYIGLSVVLHGRHSPERLFDYMSFYLALVLCWGAGAWVRVRVSAVAELRRSTAESAVTEERARIARELHDVVTHHVTAMVVQADAAQFLLPGEEDRVRKGLGAISGTGRQALTELRDLLGLLDDEDGAGGPAAPGLARLPDLVDTARVAGQPVELIEYGAAPRPAGASVELAAYRVVQEGLTNAVKHAPAHRTTVEVRYGHDAVEIQVTTAGPPPAALPVPVLGGSGRGLTGLRDRVSRLDGDLTARPGPDGSFVLTARLPLSATIDVPHD